MRSRRRGRCAASGCWKCSRAANLTAAPLRVDERVLHYLAGSNLLDPRLESLLRHSPAPEWIAEEQQAIADRAARLLRGYAQYSPLLHLCGDDPLGHEDIAARAADELQRRLLVVKAEELPAIGPELDQFASLWERDSVLLPGALLVQGGSARIVRGGQSSRRTAAGRGVSGRRASPSG